MILTLGKMPFGKIGGMDDEADSSWRNLESWQRVQWARRWWQTRKFGSLSTARAAAESLGMKEDTYSAYERAPDASKHTPLSHPAAARFAEKFGVKWEWLLTGRGEPFGDPPRGPKARILAAIEEAAGDPDELERKADAIVTLLRASNAKR